MAVLLCAALALAACATTVKEYVGGQVITGTGGTREIVEGVEIWDNGSPPRAFRVIGILEDTRGAGILPMLSRKSDIASAVKKAGGDAVVVFQDGTELAGMINQSFSQANVTGSATRVGNTAYGNAYGTSSQTSVTTPAYRRNLKAAIIKYQ
jgi:hypothetical protein